MARNWDDPLFPPDTIRWEVKARTAHDTFGQTMMTTGELHDDIAYEAVRRATEEILEVMRREDRRRNENREIRMRDPFAQWNAATRDFLTFTTNGAGPTILGVGGIEIGIDLGDPPKKPVTARSAW